MNKLRICQQGSLLVALTSAQGLLAPHALAISSDYTINTPQSDVQIANAYDRVIITDQGSATAPPSGSALHVMQGISVNTLNNDGSISADNANMYTQSNGIWNEGTIGTLNNTGTITYTGNNNAGNNAAVYNTGEIGTFNNEGTIKSAYIGIRNDGLINTLTNNSKISGSLVGLYNRNNAAINNNAGSVIINNGLISGAYGIYSYNYLNNTSTLNLVNNGTITGTTYAIHASGNNGSAMVLANSGTIKGTLRSDNGASLEIIGGSNNNVGVLTGTNGIGKIQSASDVFFRSGSLLLNDNINTPGTVVNDAASLQVNTPLNITGNYHQNATGALILGVADNAIATGDKAADTSYGRLVVSGAATVDAGSSVSLARTGNTYQFAAGQRYVVIDANSANTNYNAGTLNYKAAGYDGLVTGSTVTDNTNSALVVTLEKPPVVVTPPEVSVPVETPVVVTPPVVITPVETTPVVTTPAEKPPVVTVPEVTTPVVTTPVLPPVVVTPPVTAPAEPQPAEPVRATTPNATASLGGLANYSGISPQLLELYNASLAIDGEQEANRVGERLSTGQSISASTATGVANSTAMSVVGNHMDTVRNPQTAGASGVSTGDDYSNWIVWGQPFGGYARQDTTDDVSGYSAKFGGLILGADRALGDDWRVGAAMNYSNTSVHGKNNLSGNTSTADNYGVIGYAAYTGNPWFLNLSAAVNRQNYDSVRRADFTGFSGTAKGKFNGQSVTLQSEFGYPLTLPAQVVVTPLAALAYSYQHVDGYKESGGNGMALDVDASHSQSVISDIGVRVQKTVDTPLGALTPFAQISWIHQYDNRRMSNNASYVADTLGETQFTTKGASPVKDMAGLAVGTTLYSANDLTIDARYDVQASDTYQAHTFSLRLNKSF
ncbi:autotransporter family protein [Enterobacter sp. SA187]|uniref:autotransporter family protein n=1 Tax=Enterobacter sp. SA187 TaxID=1914861 RepID=UPI000933ACD8|nr:autotransporter outer membrane beta-barrel domain-containing protein [Enterobacter sp. SA187]